MASPLANLLDKRKLAETRARFKAWWDGAEFDPASVEAANESGEPEMASEADLFNEPERDLPPRLAALTRLWGAGRILPGDDTADALAPAQLGAPEDGRIAILGPGLAGPVQAFAGAHPGPIDAHEWRDETYELLGFFTRRAKLGERVTTARIDLETLTFEPEKFDGVWSLDEFSFVDEPTRLAHQIAKALKPDRCVLVECYAGLPSSDIAPAFASAFAEPHIRAAGDIAHFLMESGLKIEAQDDLTEEHIASVREAFRGLESGLREGGGLDVAAARELAWEAEAWRARLKLLAAGRLERRRIVARRPAG